MTAEAVNTSTQARNTDWRRRKQNCRQAKRKQTVSYSASILPTSALNERSDYFYHTNYY